MSLLSTPVVRGGRISEGQWTYHASLALTSLDLNLELILHGHSNDAD